MGSEPPGKIDLFAVHEKLLVEPAARLEGVTADREGGSHDPRDRARTAVIPSAEQPFANNGHSTEDVGQAGLTHDQIQRAREGERRVLELAVGADEPRTHYRDVRMFTEIVVQLADRV